MSPRRSLVGSPAIRRMPELPNQSTTADGPHFQAVLDNGIADLQRKKATNSRPSHHTATAQKRIRRWGNGVWCTVMCGRRPIGKVVVRLMQRGRVRSCVRPVCQDTCLLALM